MARPAAAARPDLEREALWVGWRDPGRGGRVRSGGAVRGGGAVVRGGGGVVRSGGAMVRVLLLRLARNASGLEGGSSARVL